MQLFHKVEPKIHENQVIKDGGLSSRHTIKSQIGQKKGELNCEGSLQRTLMLYLQSSNNFIEYSFNRISH